MIGGTEPLGVLSAAGEQIVNGSSVMNDVCVINEAYKNHVSARFSPPKKPKRRARQPWGDLEETPDIYYPTMKRRRGGTRKSSASK